jgi:hypothetical protein
MGARIIHILTETIPGAFAWRFFMANPALHSHELNALSEIEVQTNIG